MKTVDTLPRGRWMESQICIHIANQKLVEEQRKRRQWDLENREPLSEEFKEQFRREWSSLVNKIKKESV